MPETTDRLTEAEYLVRERAAEYRSEYRGGRMVAMTGASRAHNVIRLNLAREVSAQLRGRPCEAYVNDMRVKVAAAGLYTYADLVVVCGEPAFEDATLDTLLNPGVIVEVLSPSTEAYDRGEKFAHYRRLETLREYVLIAQDRLRVERFVREAADPDRWRLSELSQPDASLELATIGCAVPLREIYERVTVPPAAGPPRRD